MTFEQFLKTMRRNVYIHNGAWRTGIVAPSMQVLNVAFDEAKQLLEASSLGIEKVNYATRTIHIERGGPLRFFALGQPLDAYSMAGHQFTQLGMLYGRYQEGDEPYLHSLVRSPDEAAQKDVIFAPYVTL